MDDTPSPIFGDRFREGLNYAVTVHASQARKGTHIPYLGHVLGVCSLVIDAGGSENQAIAALLHDAAEDQGGRARLADIKERFGAPVAAIVEACSDTFDDPKPDWRPRKQDYIDRLRTKSTDALLVSLADKVHNARSILADLSTDREALWDRFTGKRAGTLWYYRQLADVFSQRLPGDPLAEQLAQVVGQIEELDQSITPA